MEHYFNLCIFYNCLFSYTPSVTEYKQKRQQQIDDELGSDDTVE